jgi:hypothetical protein
LLTLTTACLDKGSAFSQLLPVCERGEIDRFPATGWQTGGVFKKWEKARGPISRMCHICSLKNADFRGQFADDKTDIQNRKNPVNSVFLPPKMS